MQRKLKKKYNLYGLAAIAYFQSEEKGRMSSTCVFMQ
jgi:hypothetical protein